MWLAVGRDQYADPVLSYALAHGRGDGDRIAYLDAALRRPGAARQAGGVGQQAPGLAGADSETKHGAGWRKNTPLPR